MNEELNHAHSNPETSFEREDLSARGVFVFMIGLAITSLVIYFIIEGMYSFLDKYEYAQMTTASPLVARSGRASRVISKDYVEKQFKENDAPLLESDERGQFKDFLLKQEEQLNSYGWVDQPAGVAHIPIDRAIDLIAERGLPVLPKDGAAEVSTEVAPKMPVKKATQKQ